MKHMPVIDVQRSGSETAVRFYGRIYTHSAARELDRKSCVASIGLWANICTLQARVCSKTELDYDYPLQG